MINEEEFEDDSTAFYLSDEDEIFEDCIEDVQNSNTNSDANLEALNCAFHLNYNIHQINTLLKNITNVNQQDMNGNTILHFACQQRPGNFEIINTLIHAGSDVNIKNNKGNTPLLETSPFDIPIIELLLEEGADVLAHNKNDDNILFLALYEYCYELLFFLKEYGCDLTAKYNNQTLLSHAIAYHYSGSNGDKANSLLKVIDILCSSGCDIDEVDSEGETALSCACMNLDNDVIISLLNHGANPNIPNNKGDVPLKCAIMHNNINLVNLLLDHSANPNIVCKTSDPLLVDAVRNRNFQIVKLLLEYGCHVDKITKVNEDYYGISNTALHEACFTNNIEMVRLLLIHDCNLNKVNNLGETALHLACCHGFLNIAKLLIDSGSNINIYDNKGLSVLKLAQCGGHEEIIKLLRKKISNIAKEVLSK